MSHGQTITMIIEKELSSPNIHFYLAIYFTTLSYSFVGYYFILLTQ